MQQAGVPIETTQAVWLIHRHTETNGNISFRFIKKTLVNRILQTWARYPNKNIFINLRAASHAQYQLKSMWCAYYIRFKGYERHYLAFMEVYGVSNTNSNWFRHLNLQAALAKKTSSSGLELNVPDKMKGCNGIL